MDRFYQFLMQNDLQKYQTVNLIYNQSHKQITRPPKNISNWKDWKSCSRCGISYREDDELGMRNCYYHPKRFDRRYGYYQCCRNPRGGIRCRGCQQKDHMQQYQEWIMLSEGALELIHRRRRYRGIQLFHPDAIIKTYPEYDNQGRRRRRRDQPQQHQQQQQGEEEQEYSDEEEGQYSEEEDQEEEEEREQQEEEEEEDENQNDHVENFMLICRDSYANTIPMVKQFDRINKEGEEERNIPQIPIIEPNRSINPFLGGVLTSRPYV